MKNVIPNILQLPTPVVTGIQAGAVYRPIGANIVLDSYGPDLGTGSARSPAISPPDDSVRVGIVKKEEWQEFMNAGLATLLGANRFLLERIKAGEIRPFPLPATDDRWRLRVSRDPCFTSPRKPPMIWGNHERTSGLLKYGVMPSRCR